MSKSIFLYVILKFLYVCDSYIIGDQIIRSRDPQEILMEYQIMERISKIPINVNVQRISNTTAHIVWSQPIITKSINGYNLYIKNVEHEQTEKRRITENLGNTMSYIINNLKPYSLYKVWVTSLNKQPYDYDYESISSIVIDIRTDVTGPSAPLILNVSCESKNAIHIQWQTPSVFNHTIDYYYVYYKSEKNEEFQEVFINAKPVIVNNLLHEDLIIRELIEGIVYEVKVQGVTRSVKNSTLLYRGEFSDMKMIKLQPNWTGCYKYLVVMDPNEKSINTNDPRIISNGGVTEIREGENVDLQCQVENLGEYLILWNFHRNTETELLFAGNLRLTAEPRYSLNNDTFSIKGIQRNLFGNYSCLISKNPPQEIVFTINLLDNNNGYNNNTDVNMPSPSNNIEDAIVPKDANTNYEKLIKIMESNLETKINNMETLIHEKFDELLKLSDTINRRIKRIGESTIGSLSQDNNNSALWDD